MTRIACATKGCAWIGALELERASDEANSWGYELWRNGAAWACPKLRGSALFRGSRERALVRYAPRSAPAKDVENPTCQTMASSGKTSLRAYNEGVCRRKTRICRISGFWAIMLILRWLWKGISVTFRSGCRMDRSLLLSVPGWL